jgi:hypothetical protein
VPTASPAVFALGFLSYGHIRQRHAAVPGSLRVNEISKSRQSGTVVGGNGTGLRSTAVGRFLGRLHLASDFLVALLNGAFDWRCRQCGADRPWLKCRAGRTCQVRVRAVCLLRAAATRLIHCIHSCRLLTLETLKRNRCRRAARHHCPGRCSRLHRWLAADHQPHSRHVRHRCGGSDLHMLGRLERVRDPNAVRDPLC